MTVDVDAQPTMHSFWSGKAHLAHVRGVPRGFETAAKFESRVAAIHEVCTTTVYNSSLVNVSHSLRLSW